ncbi:metal-sensing transcriptional repressor [Sphingobium yanoikuyae]|uniref:Metal-sensing transcriptional repressor n=1 Tax=Sphingobium yanoikuyae TaxID=13690 RepID=A0AA42X2E7_SPHYA|nr:metal-sensing transcriptional repressor [Sphingobium yanoikuyae]MDH2135168.1 metal-sensing transcriptional repressor [Sphingobium yanoikuyae]MDH2151686.1 metal-sensing transcriptional repressor [Sphingobium yanoikuyae]MDH2170496.1 metal-sensing transcriptional repressor [Sphingobium yanoikuyae]
MDNGELADRFRRIEQQIGEIRERVQSGHSKADILVAVHAAREVLALFGSDVIGDGITEELATTAASEDPNTRSQRLEALLDLLPYVAF